MVAVDAQVYARQAGLSSLIAGFEVQDDVVFVAAGVIVAGPGIGFGFPEQQRNISGSEALVLGERLYFNRRGPRWELFSALPACG